LHGTTDRASAQPAARETQRYRSKNMSETTNKIVVTIGLFLMSCGAAVNQKKCEEQFKMIYESFWLPSLTYDSIQTNNTNELIYSEHFLKGPYRFLSGKIEYTYSNTELWCGVDEKWEICFVVEDSSNSIFRLCENMYDDSQCRGLSLENINSDNKSSDFVCDESNGVQLYLLGILKEMSNNNYAECFEMPDSIFGASNQLGLSAPNDIDLVNWYLHKKNGASRKTEKSAEKTCEKLPCDNNCFNGTSHRAVAR
jgi:hypothetical protein